MCEFECVCVRETEKEIERERVREIGRESERWSLARRRERTEERKRAG